MDGIKHFNDDCIWFSKELAEEFMKIGKEISKKILFFRPKVGSITYDNIAPDLLPNDADYKDWREKFKKPK